MALVGYVFVLDRWDPTLVERETEPYLRFLLYRMGELLHFKNKPARGLPIFSTVCLIQHLLSFDWRSKLNSEEMVSILEDLRLRLVRGTWLSNYWLDEISNLCTAISEDLATLQPSAAKHPKVSAIIPKTLETLQRLQNKCVFIQSGVTSVAKELIELEKTAILNLIHSSGIDHEQKLVLLDRYVTDFTRDLLHYGHSMDFLYRNWLVYTILNPTSQKDPRGYLERFNAMDGLLRGNQKFTVLNRIEGMRSEEPIGTSELQFLSTFPPQYKVYEGYEKVQYWHEEDPSGPRRSVDECRWVKQEVEAKDGMAACIEATMRLLQYVDIITKLPRRLRKHSLEVRGNPLVIDEHRRTIQAGRIPRSLHLVIIPSASYLYTLKDKWLSSGISYNEETLQFLLEILDWIIQAEQFHIRRRRSLTPGSALFLGLWTAFEHFFSSVNWFECCPPYVALTHIHQELRSFSSILRYFEKTGMMDMNNTKLRQIQRLKEDRSEAAILELCHQMYTQKDEAFTLLAKESFLEYKLLKVAYLHPAMKTQPVGGRGTTCTLLEELKRLEIETKSNLTLLAKHRNALVHSRPSLSAGQFYIMTKILTDYLSRLVHYTIFRFGRKPWASFNLLHRDVNAIYRELKNAVRKGQLATDTETLLRPQRLKYKRGRLAQAVKMDSINRRRRPLL